MNTWTPNLCGRWALLAKCPNGHKWARGLVCGREWCPTCGAYWSDAHQRRYSTWLPKAQQVATMGYLVITVPMGERPKFRDVAKLRSFRRSVVRGLKARGYARGLSRWHFYSEEQPGVFNPHLNLLLDAGRIAPNDLAELKLYLANRLGVSMVVINYRYSARREMKLHWLKYVTRATFTDCTWDEDLADRLYKFNNTHSWGVWKGPTVWVLPPGQEEAPHVVEQLERGVCPICDAPLEWVGRELVEYLPGLGYSDIGSGYWRRP